MALETEGSVWNDETTWTNFAQTAKILELDPSTLTRQAKAGRVWFVTRGLGRGERLVPTREVLRLACMYRRTPTDVVVRRLAAFIALRLLLDENLLVRDLTRILRVVAAEAHFRPRSAPPGLPNAAPRAAAAVPPAQERSEPAQARAVTLGRMRPGPSAVDDLTVEPLWEAADSIRPREPRVKIIRHKTRVLDLGRLRPGLRY